MSFASEVKKELSIIEPEKTCCQLAEIAGFLRVAGGVSLSGGKFGVIASTGDLAIVRHYKRLIKSYFHKDVKISIEEKQLFGTTKQYILAIGSDEGGEEILRETNLLMIKRGQEYFTDGIYEPLIKSKCCKKAYLRGMFLGAGTISDPINSYHLEFNCGTEVLAKDLKKLIDSFVNMSSSVSKRRGKYVVYMKKMTYIRDMLAIMGAHPQVLYMEETQIRKQIRGRTVRAINCDTANMDRTIDAAADQIKAIKELKKKGKFDQLSPKVKEIAELRLTNPEASLSQLGDMLDPPLKKSGVNNRIKRLMELARN